jgi:hypothetical protein
MIRLASSRPVAEETRRNLGLQAGSAEMLENLEIRQVPGTTFIDLTYRGTNRKKATQTVNTLARVSSERLSEAGSKNLMAAVWEDAQVQYPNALPYADLHSSAAPNLFDHIRAEVTHCGRCGADLAIKSATHVCT